MLAYPIHLVQMQIKLTTAKVFYNWQTVDQVAQGAGMFESFHDIMYVVYYLLTALVPA